MVRYDLATELLEMDICAVNSEYRIAGKKSRIF